MEKISNNIMFFQSSQLGEENISPGLFDIFYAHLSESRRSSIFSKLQVIVPNHAFAVYLRDRVTKADGISANLDFVVLVGTVLENIYLENNPDAQLFDFRQSRFIIYEYLLNTSFDDLEESEELKNYIIVDGVINKFRAYQLASQLQQIFHEYLYLRTHELIHLEKAKLPHWQKQIFRHLSDSIGSRKLFIDIYQYFIQLDLNDNSLKLPERLYLFGLTSVYPSQLEIIIKISQKIPVYWYYQPCSYEYYGDLLSTKARSSLEQKLLRKPDLSLDDLYLLDGNPLLANLGQQSREFIELLRANDVEVYSFNTEFSEKKQAATMLEIIQDDIRNLKYRVRNEYRLSKDNLFYMDPVKLLSGSDECVSDLPNGKTSIKINICHNRMREVQVLFNELSDILSDGSGIIPQDILITAPDIDDYATYIRAVFDNETAYTSSGIHLKIPYHITGHREQGDYKVLETLKLLLNLPYQLPVNYLLELLMQTEIRDSLFLDNDDIETIKGWFIDNRVNFGFNEKDYEPYGYQNFSVHSFKTLLQNIVSGACLSEDVLISANHVPLYRFAEVVVVPYDNIDSGQIELCSKLIGLIDLLFRIREFLYLEHNLYREFSIDELHEVFALLQEQLLNNPESGLLLNKFIGSILDINSEIKINLLIVNQIIDDYMSEIKNKIRFESKITCASLQYMRNIPHRVIYMLGLNFGEFPAIYQPNQLSILAKEWHLADRNYNIEDKQAFLDTILSARERLIISYIGRKETDNSEIKPSPILSLFMNVLGQSFTNFWDEGDPMKPRYNYRNIIYQHSLHPFYNNHSFNYSEFWQKLARITTEKAQNLRWEFSGTQQISLTSEQKQILYQPKLVDLVATFCYSNRNLYRTLGINTFINEIELEDRESIAIFDRNLAKEIFKFFECYLQKASLSELSEYLQAKGVLAYDHIGKLQFDYYARIYQLYKANCGNSLNKFYLEYPVTKGEETIDIILQDEVFVEGNAIIITPGFEQISDRELPTKLEEVSYSLKIRALICGLLLQCDVKFDAGIKPDSVIIRLIRNNAEIRNFPVYVQESSSLFDMVIKYYLRSLTYPVLIHKSAIAEYAKRISEVDRKGNLKNTREDCLRLAKAKYLVDFNNFELDGLREDIIFSSIAEDYFEFIDSSGSINDIARIAELLSHLRG
ncbi:exodeoxyribonuclease V subunit gamma [Aquella oligotrophica]|uniref:Uncharacterized protein n=1 Tax=Aquella oligotrophica TaxID=2067065 RepID=A0A2I7N8E2_9NEIS|nr:exodeoxyribonuclease V subunit gamma [Aquella oligotrophica]AUR52727.1 hypothetical protein CUN60_10600 [Aquella oligotrophica]